MVGQTCRFAQISERTSAAMFSRVLPPASLRSLTVEVRAKRQLCPTFYGERGIPLRKNVKSPLVRRLFGKRKCCELGQSALRGQQARFGHLEALGLSHIKASVLPD